MNSDIGHCKLWLRVWIFCVTSHIVSCSVSHGKENAAEELQAFMDDKLRLFKRDLVKSIMNEQSQNVNKLYKAEIATESVQVSYQQHASLQVVQRADNFYSMQYDGIYRLSNPPLMGPKMSFVSNSTLENRVANMDINHVQFVSAFQWKNIYFLLISTSKSYSYICTLDANLRLVPRQSIKNPNIATAATFFSAGDSLFLVLATGGRSVDRSVTEIYKWSGTYMDRIYEIMTKGSVVLSTYANSGYQYILIAQDHDANPQVGTQVWKMNPATLELAKVQLLKSFAPVVVSTFKAGKEYFAIIGNKNYLSSVFWWEGTEFVEWQVLKEVKGCAISFDTLHLADDQTFLLAAGNSKIYLYSKWGAQFMLEYSKSLDVDNIQEAKFFSIADDYYIIINAFRNGQAVVLAIPVTVSTVPLEPLIEKDPLLRIMLELSSRLKQSRGTLDQLKGQLKQILTCNRDATFTGSLKIQKVHLKLGHIANLEILSGRSDLKETASTLENKTQEVVQQAKYGVAALDKLVFKTLPGTIEGDLTIKGNLHADTASVPKLVTNRINMIEWRRLANGTLQYHGEQTLTGDLNVQEMSITKMNLRGKLSGADMMDYMSYLSRSQNVTGNHTMEKNLRVQEGFRNVSAVNGISLKDVVVKSDGPTFISGTKKMNLVVRGNITTGLINKRHFRDWYDDAVSTSSSNQYVEGSLVFNTDVDFNKLSVGTLNERNFEAFANSVVIQGKDQKIKGSVNFDSMTVSSLDAVKINNVFVHNLLTTVKDQHIESNIHVKKMKLNQDLSTKTVNGLEMSNVASKSSGNTFNGSITFGNLTVTKEVITNESVKVNGLDLSEVHRLKKYQIYLLRDGQQLNRLKTTTMIVPSINSTTLANILNNYWRVNGNQTISVQVAIPNMVTFSGNVNTQTLNLLHPQDLLLAGGTQTVQSFLHFYDVSVLKDVIIEPGVTINGVDVLQLEAVMKSGMFWIDGLKTFVGGLILPDGAIIGKLNGLSIPDDIVSQSSTSLNIEGVTRLKHLRVEHLNSRGNLNAATMNSIDVYQMLDNAVMIDEPAAIQGHVTIEVVHAPDIVVSGEVNGIDLDTFGNVIHLNGELNSLQVGGNANFLGHLEVKSWNGIPVTPHLNMVVNKSEDNMVHGVKSMSSVTVKGNLGTPTVNDIDLHQLQEVSLSLTKDQSIRSTATFQNVIANELTAQVIDGVNVDDVALTTEATVLRGGLTVFGNVTIQGNLLLGGNINNCDIRKVAKGLYKASDRTSSSLTVQGSATWKASKYDRKQLSYLFENAVSKTKDEVVLGRGVFDDIVLHGVTSDAWINGVDLMFIEQDALYKAGDQTVAASKSFQQLALNSAKVFGNMGLMVNGFDLHHLNHTLVRISGNQLVRGNKTFASLNAENLIVEDSIDGIVPSDLVTVHSNKVIPQAELSQLRVKQDATFGQLNGLSIGSLLEQRITLSKSEEILGPIIFTGNVHAEQAHANFINVDLNDLVFASPGSTINITGKKSFQNLSTKGSLAVGTVNGRTLEDLRNAITVDQDETLSHATTFEAMTEIEADVAVVGTVNGIKVAEMPGRLHSRFTQLQAALMPSVNISRDYKLKLQSSFEQLGDMPSEYQYMHELLNVNVPSVEHVTYRANPDSLWINLHAASKESCNLPHGCKCTAQTVILIENEELLNETLPEWSGSRQYQYELLDGEMILTISTNTVSFEERCVSSDHKKRERTNISIMTQPRPNLSTYVPEEHRSFTVTDERTGYISDTKAFHHAGTTYVILAIYFDRELNSYNVSSVVKGIEKAEVVFTQEIPTHGVRRLELIKLDKNTYHLVVLNTMNEEKSTFSRSEIYTFVPEKKRFELLRTVNTMGARDVTHLQVDSNVFIIFTQQTPYSAIGLKHHVVEPIQIYEYRHDFSNYYLYQSLYLPRNVLSVSALILAEDAYITVATEGSLVYLYKYGFTRGFYETERMTINGVQNMFPMYVRNEVYLLAAALNDTKILKINWMGKKPFVDMDFGL